MSWGGSVIPMSDFKPTGMRMTSGRKTSCGLSTSRRRQSSLSIAGRVSGTTNRPDESHVRLAHTHVTHPEIANYTGETDPRKLPLVVAPFLSVPLLIDQAMHVRFQDLVIRGGGFNTVVLQFGVGIEFDNVTTLAATYGIRSRSTGPFRMVNSAIHGGIPPWGSRNENSLHTYTPRLYDPFVTEADVLHAESQRRGIHKAGEPSVGSLQDVWQQAPTKGRNVARLPTHALLVTEGTYEFEVFAYPRNHDWDISHCDFTDAHDGVYLSGHTIRFHNNRVDNIQDDGIYLSSPVPYFSDEIFIYQNLITRSLMAFGCHSRGGPTGDIYIFRNIADLRGGVYAGRGTPQAPDGRVTTYQIFLMHGRGRRSEWNRCTSTRTRSSAERMRMDTRIGR